MEKQPFYYAYFLFKSSTGQRHELRVRVTPSLSLEWSLYIDDVSLGTFLDTSTNILISAQLENTLSYSNVERVYAILLETGK